MPARFRIVIISPGGYRHAQAFAEVGETIYHAIRANGFEASIGYNRFSAGAIHILLGANLVGGLGASEIPDGTIVYNLEQVDPGSPWWHDGLKTLVERCETWDYSARNIDTFAALGVRRKALHIPLGSVPELARIAPSRDEQVDVLFYGSVNERRQKVLDALRARGLNVVQLFGVYGRERDAAIARSKLVLNLHLYPSKILEVVRVSYLLQNRKAVVAERSHDTALEPGIDGAVLLAPYEGLVEACAALLARPAERARLAQAGYQWIMQRPMAAILAPHLARLAAGHAVPALAAVPARLRLGGFLAPPEGWLGADAANVAADIVLDPGTLRLPAGETVHTERFGPVSLAPEWFEVIDAGEWPSLVPDLETFLRDCARLLRAGGMLHIDVPHELSGDAWSHPRARRAFSERSFAGWADLHVSLGWADAAFETTDMKFDLSALGTQLQAGGADADAVFRTPRAVKRIRIALRRCGHRALPGAI